MATAKLEIEATGPTTAQDITVKLDDVDITKVVSRLKLQMAVGEVHTAELTVLVGPVHLRGDAVNTLVRDKLAGFYKDKDGTWHEPEDIDIVIDQGPDR
jgi:hypothetical protein